MRAFAVCLILFGGGAAAIAQPLADFPVTQRVAPTILTVDIDRLFAVSEFGQRISTDYTAGRTALSDENRRIAQALREEELALANQRAGMDIAVFRSEAAAFDDKAQAIRRAQDAKERALEDGLERGREQFLVVTQPILGEMMVERGASAILDRRTVLLALGSIDITEEAVVRINDAIGDGSTLDQQP